MNKAKAEGELLTFLEEWYGWANSEVVTTKFSTFQGLCSNLRTWAIANSASYHERLELLSGLRECFRADGMDYHYPFGEEEYDIAQQSGIQHKVVERLNWVKKVIENSKKGVSLNEETIT